MKVSRTKGQTLVETSLILAVFLGLLLTMLGAGEMLFVKQILSERVNAAARWGATKSYDPRAIRNIVLYGSTAPEKAATAFVGLNDAQIVITAPDCPGAQCRITVAIPSRGLQSTEPAEYDLITTDGISLKP